MRSLYHIFRQLQFPSYTREHPPSAFALQRPSLALLDRNFPCKVDSSREPKSIRVKKTYVRAFASLLVSSKAWQLRHGFAILHPRQFCFLSSPFPICSAFVEGH